MRLRHCNFNSHPCHPRTRAAVFWQYGINAAVVFATPYLMDWSVGYTMLVFAGTNILNLAFVIIFIKETKGVPLEEIPALFK